MWNKIKDYLKDEKWHKAIAILALFVILLLTYHVGTLVGRNKAFFACRVSDNYPKMFGFDRNRPMMGFGQDDFSNSHGTIGRIVKISLPTIVVADRDNVEKVVVVDNKTIIRSLRNTVDISKLKVDDFIMVIGAPNDKTQIEAKLIRLMPEIPNLVDGRSPTKTNFASTTDNAQ